MVTYHTYRIYWKIALVFVLLLTTSSIGNYTMRSVQAAASEPYIGEIQLFPYNYAPHGWVFAAGQTLSINNNTALYSLLGTQYGGDGRTQFSLPNLTSLPVADGMGYYIATQGIYPSRDGDIGMASALTGEVRLFPYSFTPSGWLKLNGQQLASASYYELSKVMGWQNNPSFTLPDIPAPLPNTPLFFAVSTNSVGIQDGNDIAQGTGSEYIGETIPFVAPMQTDWPSADGRLVSLANNQALYALLQNKFGGSDYQRFGLPNLTNNPYSFRYYIVANTGVYPSRGDGGSPPSSLAGNAATYTVAQGQQLSIRSSDLLSGIDGTGVSLRSQPQHGSVQDVGAGFIYYASSNYVGDDHFTIRTYNTNGFANGYSTINIKVEAPVPPLINGVTNQGIYNTAVTPIFNSGSALLNGRSFTSGTSVTAEGNYTLQVVNKYGTTTIQFTIDLTPPTVSGINSGGRYTVPPTITWSDGTATLNGAAFTSGTQISQEGQYTLVATDAVNNSISITFSYYAPRQLTFDSAGGTSVAAQNLYYGDHGVEPSAPTRTGYTFTGWYIDAAHTQLFNFDSTTITANTKLYAGWSINQYTVSFDSSGGTTVAPVPVNYGLTVSEPTAPTRTGYTFTGWYTDAARTQPFNFGSTAITANTQLYAGWNINQYTVSFDSDGGTAVADRQLNYGSLVSEPTTPTRTGYTFAGWYTDAAHTKRYDFAAVTVAADLQLYASWALQSYTVSFDAYQGANVSKQIVPYGTLITRPADPVQAGHTFNGWYADAARTQIFDFQALIMTSMTVYAGWDINQYTASFNSNGGTTVSDQQLDYGSPLAEPQQPSRTGYTFTGWYSDADLQQRYDFATSAIRGDMQLYAGWERNQYTVSFDTYGGSVVRDVYIGYGDRLTLPSAPTADQTGSIFAGWFADPQHNTPFDFNQPIISNIILYAKWAARVQQITFDTAGGTAIRTQSAAYGDLLSRPGDPDKTGYTFAGWYQDSAYQQPFHFEEDTITSDMTLYAKWNLSSYQVTFETEGGAAVQPQTVYYGQSASAPVDPIRSGYTFTGWYTDSSQRQPFDFETVKVTADLRLYAGWLAVPQPEGHSNNPGKKDSNSSDVKQTDLNSTTSQITIPIGRSGELRLGSGMLLQIPAGASNQPLEITANRASSSASGLERNQRLISPVYELTKNITGNFSIPVQLTLQFNPALLTDKETQAVFYQTRENTPWIRIDDQQVNDDTIAVRVNHFTRFAVMAVTPETLESSDSANPVNNKDSSLDSPAAEFSDLNGHWAAASIREAASLGIVKGYADGTFHPGAAVTRAEFASMLVRTIQPKAAASGAVPFFTDQADIGAWSKDAIAQASMLGWIQGNADGSFRPNDPITRAEMAVMVSRASTSDPSVSSTKADFTDGEKIPVWARFAADWMQQNGIMHGRANGQFDPAASTTRAEAAQVLMLTRSRSI